MTTASTLLCWRVFLMLIMITMVVLGQWAEDWNADFRLEYYSNWGVYITLLVTIINVCATVKYKNSLNRFTLKLNKIRDDYERHSSRASLPPVNKANGDKIDPTADNESNASPRGAKSMLKKRDANDHSLKMGGGKGVPRMTNNKPKQTLGGAVSDYSSNRESTNLK